MTIRVAGVLKRPDNTPAAFAALRIISLSNFGEVLISSFTQAECNEFGQYDLALNFGQYLVEVRYGSHYEILGRISVHQECADPSSLSVLLAQSKPITPDEISYLETLLSSTQLAAGEASTTKIIIESMRDEVEADRAEVAAKAEQVAFDAENTRTNTATVLSQARDVDADHAEVTALAAQVRQDAIDAKNARDAIEERLVDPDTDFPVPPDSVLTKRFDTHIELYPKLDPMGYYTDFEYFSRGEDPAGERVYVTRGRMGSMQGLLPNRHYYFSVRTVNAQGASAYVDVDAITTQTGTAEKELVGLQPDDNLGDILNQIDTDLTNMDSMLQDQVVTIGLIDTSQKNLNTHVNTELDKVNAWQAEYAQRVAEGEALIDAVVYRDPANGQIINKAFQYSDSQYTEAGLRIDGVQAQIDLTVSNMTALDDTVTSHEARLSLAESEIQLRATFSEVDSKIAGALAALEPAYSWQFNTSVDSWTGVTWNNEGFVDYVGPMAITGISFVAEDNPTFRLNVRTSDHTTCALFLSWNGGNQNVVIPYNTQDNVWEVRTLNLGASDGWTGTITSLQISGSGSNVSIDAVVVGKPNANEQELANITARVATVEETLDAENARWSVYVTTDFWNANALTTTDVQQVIDGWDAAWGIRATINQINEEGTVTKANQAKIWVDGADANVKLIANSWWSEHPDSAALNQASIDIDGLRGMVITNVSSISGIDADQFGLGQEQVEIAYRQFLDAHGIANLEVAMATAESQLVANTEGQSALAQSITNLEAANSAANARMSAIEQAVVDEHQAWTAADTQMSVTMDNNLAEAKLYTRSAVNYWTDDKGNMVEPPADPENPPAGWTLVDGPLSEDIRQIKITTGDGSYASLANLAQVFENKDGELIARGGMILDNNGRITGMVATDDGRTSNLDIMAGNFRVGVADGTSFQPMLWLDTNSNKMVFSGQLLLSDGFLVTSEDDIRALDGVDGDTIYVEYQHSADGTSWHSDMLDGDVWRRQRTVTNGVGGSWSAAARIRGVDGIDGVDGYTPVKGVDYFDGEDGVDGKHGAFHSYVFKTAATRPAAPTGGSFNGTSETVPTGWADDPYFTAGQVTWVSHRVYTHNGSSWVGGSWSTPAEYSKQGIPGEDGIDGIDGVDGKHGLTHIYTEENNGIFPQDSTATTRFTTLAGRAPLDGDRMTYYKMTAGKPSAAETRLYQGGAWTGFVLVVHGNQLVQGTVVADSVVANISISSPIITGGSINISSGKFKVTSTGYLTATQATITGTIYANAGYFKGSITGASGHFSGTIDAVRVNGAIGTLFEGETSLGSMVNADALPYGQGNTAYGHYAAGTGGFQEDQFGEGNLTYGDVYYIDTGMIVEDHYWNTKVLGVVATISGSWTSHSSYNGSSRMGVEASLVPMHYTQSSGAYYTNSARMFIRVQLHGYKFAPQAASKIKWRIYEIFEGHS